MASLKLVLRTKGYVVESLLWMKRALVLGGSKVEAVWLNEDAEGSMVMTMFLSGLDILRRTVPAANLT